MPKTDKAEVKEPVAAVLTDVQLAKAAYDTACEQFAVNKNFATLSAAKAALDEAQADEKKAKAEAAVAAARAALAAKIRAKIGTAVNEFAGEIFKLGGYAVTIEVPHLISASGQRLLQSPTGDDAVDLANGQTRKTVGGISIVQAAAVKSKSPGTGAGGGRKGVLADLFEAHANAEERAKMAVAKLSDQPSATWVVKNAVRTRLIKEGIVQPL